MDQTHTHTSGGAALVGCNVKMFATHVLSAGQTDTGHYIDSHFSCESKSLFNFDGVGVGVTGGGDRRSTDEGLFY